MRFRAGLALALVLAVLVSLAPAAPSPVDDAKHPVELVAAAGESAPDALIASTRADSQLCTSLARLLRPSGFLLLGERSSTLRSPKRRAEDDAIADHRPRAAVQHLRRRPGSRAKSDSGDPL